MPSLYQTKDQYRCTWLKVYHHDITKGTFKDKEEAKYYVERDDKFSILGLINDNYKIDGKFEFMIEFPNLTNQEGQNRWAQTNNPLSISEISDSSVPGFERVTIDWTHAIDQSNYRFTFCGLALSNYEYSLLDGTCAQQKWFFSIGPLEKHRNKYIPGYTEFNYETVLWLRIERRMKRELMMFPKLVSIIGFLFS